MNEALISTVGFLFCLISLVVPGNQLWLTGLGVVLSLGALASMILKSRHTR